MKNQPVLHINNLPVLNQYKILLDTNFIIESNRHASAFVDLLAQLKEHSQKLIILEVVKREFLIGARTKSDLDNFENFLKQIVSDIVTDLSCFSKYLYTVIRLYAGSGKIELEDFMMICYLLSDKNTVLLSKNHKDFNLKIFDRLGFVLVEYSDGFQEYCFYKINPDKIKHIINDFDKTP